MRRAGGGREGGQQLSAGRRNRPLGRVGPHPGGGPARRGASPRGGGGGGGGAHSLRQKPRQAEGEPGGATIRAALRLSWRASPGGEDLLTEPRAFGRAGRLGLLRHQSSAGGGGAAIPHPHPGGLPADASPRPAGCPSASAHSPGESRAGAEPEDAGRGFPRGGAGQGRGCLGPSHARGAALGPGRAGLTCSEGGQQAGERAERPERAAGERHRRAGQSGSPSRPAAAAAAATKRDAPRPGGPVRGARAPAPPGSGRRGQGRRELRGALEPHRRAGARGPVAASATAGEEPARTCAILPGCPWEERRRRHLRRAPPCSAGARLASGFCTAPRRSAAARAAPPPLPRPPAPPGRPLRRGGRTKEAAERSAWRATRAGADTCAPGRDGMEWRLSAEPQEPEASYGRQKSGQEAWWGCSPRGSRSSPP